MRMNNLALSEPQGICVRLIMDLSKQPAITHLEAVAPTGEILRTRDPDLLVAGHKEQARQMRRWMIALLAQKADQERITNQRGAA